MNRPNGWQAQCRIATPLGPLTLLATMRGLGAALFDAQAHHPGEQEVPVQPGHPHLCRAAEQLGAYFTQGRMQFDVPLDPAGTVFQQQVWQRLLAIPAGMLITYGEIARQIGRPNAARAVGAAVGRNPLAIIVPCHRVVGADGSLTGYAAGLPRKKALLVLEAALPA